MLAQRLADLVEGLGPRAAVAFDGPDAAGKTTLADEVAHRLGRPVVRASVDGFHQPRAHRVRRGELSAEGYYLDAFDTAALRALLLEPFAGGAVAVTTSAWDHAADRPAVGRRDGIAPDAVLLVDGVFLLRPGLRDSWALAVHLHVPEEVTLERALVRDLPLLGSREAVLERYRQRYLPAQARYRQEADPQRWADVVVDNSDPAAPAVTRWQPVRPRRGR